MARVPVANYSKAFAVVSNSGLDPDTGAFKWTQGDWDRSIQIRTVESLEAQAAWLATISRHLDNIDDRLVKLAEAAEPEEVKKRAKRRAFDKLEGNRAASRRRAEEVVKAARSKLPPDPEILGQWAGEFFPDNSRIWRAVSGLFSDGRHSWQITVGELLEKTKRELLVVRHVGPATVKKIVSALAEHGLTLKADPDDEPAAKGVRE